MDYRELLGWTLDSRDFLTITVGKCLVYFNFYKKKSSKCSVMYCMFLFFVFFCWNKYKPKQMIDFVFAIKSYSVLSVLILKPVMQNKQEV